MCKVSLTASAQHMQTSRNPSGRGSESVFRSPESEVRSAESQVRWAHCGCSSADFPVSFRWERTALAAANIF